ncbi:MAG: hypothetical protein LBF89_07010 [Bacteroidales bacterium]|jgi:hypothetical protein|nr:hypothetical protein [Bacteroidales bacterium]
MNERIKKIINVFEAGSKKEFGKKVGISIAQVYNLINSKRVLKEKNLLRIIAAYPDLQETWLRSEEGSMLKDGSTPEPVIKERAAKSGKASKPRKLKKSNKTAVADKTENTESVTAKAKAKKGRAPKKTGTSGSAQTVEAGQSTESIRNIAVKTKKTVTKPKKENTLVETVRDVKNLPVEKPVKEKKIRLPRITRAATLLPGEPKSVPALNELISGQKELISTNLKLVEANQKLVEIILKQIK